MIMQIIARTEATTVYCNTAASFPEGVLKAHQILHQIYPSSEGRHFFGISRPVNGEIEYKAAVSLAPGEQPVTDRFERFVIKKGLFLSSTIHNFMDNIPSIQKTFEHLVKDPRVDHDGYCLEEYPDEKNMICMVTLDDDKVQDMHRKELAKEYGALYENLLSTILSFKEKDYNKRPFSGGWSPAQVVDHIIQATGGLPDQYTMDTDRLYSEKDEMTRSAFLNFDTKMQAPDFLQPEQRDYNRDEQVKTIEGIRDQHMQSIRDKDLFAICLDFEMPVWGTLTRYEWLKFIGYHTTRHIHQLKKIHNAV
jgi:hypothetical protein